jgi:alkylation response protein AidB-like acyl-CoA dehydrogenase
MSEDEANSLMSEWQCAKLVVNRAAADAVERAMDVCGGASYLSGHVLSRLYRDVRAGPFMQPLSPVEAYPYLGRAALGVDPLSELRQPLADTTRVQPPLAELG